MNEKFRPWIYALIIPLWAFGGAVLTVSLGIWLQFLGQEGMSPLWGILYMPLIYYWMKPLNLALDTREPEFFSIQKIKEGGRSRRKP